MPCHDRERDAIHRSTPARAAAGAAASLVDRSSPVLRSGRLAGPRRGGGAVVSRRRPSAARRLSRRRSLLRHQRLPDHPVAAGRTASSPAASIWPVSICGGLFGCCPTVLVMLVAIVRGQPDRLARRVAEPARRVLSTLTYSSNWWLIDAHHSYFVASGRPPMTQQLWSLAIEEQFYLIWPLFLLVATAGLYRIRRRIGRLPGRPIPSRWPLPQRFGGVALLCLMLACASTAAMAVQAVGRTCRSARDSSRVLLRHRHPRDGSAVRRDVRRAGRASAAGPEAVAGTALGDRPGRFWPAGSAWRSPRSGSTSSRPPLYRGGFGLVSLIAAAAVAAVARAGSRLGRACWICAADALAGRVGPTRSTSGTGRWWW